MDYKNFNLQNLKLRDSSVPRTIFSFFGLHPPRPVDFKDKRFRPWKYPSLVVLGQAIGFDEPVMIEALTLHNRRFILVRILLLLFAYLLYLPLFISVLYFFRSTIGNLTVVQAAMFSLLFLLATYITIIISFRLYSLLADKYFADSLCVASIIYLLFDLAREDVLIRPDMKKHLMSRLDYLSNKTLLLALRYASKNETNRSWVNEHFKEMELYVRERERWIIVPTENTLTSLRQDFYELAQIYIMGNYGVFAWRDVRTLPETIRPSWKQRLIFGLPRFMGITLPLLLMGLYLWQPNLFPLLQIDKGIVTFIFIAWLLLTIDATLKLGIVNGLTNLAKGIKDLA